MTHKLLLVTVFIFAFISCGKERILMRDALFEENGLIIKMSDACGWCGGTDSLKISESATYYEYIDPCGDNDFSNNILTNEEDWNELMGLLDLHDFKSIDLNTCYVCVDGCDTWISIKSDNYFHEIRFANFDSLEIQPILPFINKLNEIRSHLVQK